MRIRLLLSLCFSTLLLWPVAAQAQSSTAPPERLVVVSGEGTVHAVPDQAELRFGIVTVDPDPEEARRRNAEASRDALNAVRALGVDERKIRMETLRLQPHRRWLETPRRWEEDGFEAVREVVVIVEDLDALPEVVARVVQRGANRLNAVSYQLQDRTATRNEALREAAHDARLKASLLAETLGATLGAVHRIEEQSFSFPQPMMRFEAQEMAKADAAPEPEAYAAGEIEVRVVVQVAFVLTTP